jgi:hypothetical protein
MQSGESATRLGSVTDRKVMGVKSRGMDMQGFLSKGFERQSGALICGVKPRRWKNRHTARAGLQRFALSLPAFTP